MARVTDTTAIPAPEVKKRNFKWLIVGIIIACVIIGGALYTYFAVIRQASTGIPQPPTVQPPAPTPAPPVVPTPTPTPTPPQKIEAKWGTNGPYNVYGIESIYIYSTNGNKVRALEVTGGGSVVPWITENGGKSWTRGWGELPLTEEEDKALKNPNHYEASSHPGWTGWKDFLALFPSDPMLQRFAINRPIGTVNIFQAVDRNNSNNLLMSVVIQQFLDYEDRKLPGPFPYISRLFISQNAGRTWVELIVPSSSWESGLRVHSVALISSNGGFKIYVGLDHKGHNSSCVWQATIPQTSLP